MAAVRVFLPAAADSGRGQPKGQLSSSRGSRGERLPILPAPTVPTARRTYSTRTRVCCPQLLRRGSDPNTKQSE